MPEGYGDEFDYYEDIQQRIPGIQVTSGYRTPEYQQDMRKRGYSPAEGSGHLKGSKLDFTHPKGFDWLEEQIRKAYPQARINRESDHLDVEFPGYTKAPSIGNARDFGVLNPARSGYGDEFGIEAEDIAVQPRDSKPVQPNQTLDDITADPSDPLAGAMARPDIADPLTQELQGVPAKRSDQVAGSTLGEKPEGIWAERVWNALSTGVLPQEYANAPFGQQLDALLRIMTAGTEAIRDTPLEGLATAFPLGGLEAGILPRIKPGVKQADEDFGLAGKADESGELIPMTEEDLAALGREETLPPLDPNSPELPKEVTTYTTEEMKELLRRRGVELPPERPPVQDEVVPTSLLDDPVGPASMAKQVDEEVPEALFADRPAREGPRLEPEVAGRPEPFPEVPPTGAADDLHWDPNADNGNGSFVDSKGNILGDPSMPGGGGGGSRIPPEAPPGGGMDEPPVPPRGGDDGAGGEPPDIPNILSRLKTHLRAAKTVRQSLEEERAVARKEKFKKVLAARGMSGGREGLYVEKAALKGELPKKGFDPIPEDSFSKEEVTALFDHVKNHPEFRAYESMHARDALDKMFNGEVPTPSELNLLSKALGDDVVKEVLRHRSTGRKITEGIVDISNLPFALMSSYDLSAFRQGAFLVSRPEFWKNAPRMVKYLFSEEGHKAAMDEIRARPSYDMMEEAGVSFTDLGADLTKREENFTSKLAQKIPGITPSNRAYSGYLNKLRADVFDSIVRDFNKAGVNLSENPVYLKQLGNYINDATGRGNLGPATKYGPALNAALFSPRLQASRINLLFRPFKYLLDPFASRAGIWEATHPVIRKNYFRDLAGFSGAVMSALALGEHFLGTDVETDPRSSDFAKIKDGNTRHDVMAGFQQYLRLGSQLATGETKTLKGDIKELGKGFGSPTRFDQVITFLRSKGSPIATFVADYLDGKNVVGEPFEWQKAVLSRVTPFSFQTAAEAFEDRGMEGVMETLDGLFGIGVQTFPPPKSGEGYGDEVRVKEGYGDDTESEGDYGP